MNILEHILAGHYPKDSTGRSLVPRRGGGHVVVCATDVPGACPILGYHMQASGERAFSQIGDGAFGYFPDSEFLLPPPPRKVEVKAYMVVGKDGCVVSLHRHDPHMATDLAGSYPNDRVVELTGSYEEPWS